MDVWLFLHENLCISNKKPTKQINQKEYRDKRDKKYNKLRQQIWDQKKL